MYCNIINVLIYHDKIKHLKTNSKLFQTDKKQTKQKNSRNTSCYPETHLKIQFSSLKNVIFKSQIEYEVRKIS